jgi:hypothetical protein
LEDGEIDGLSVLFADILFDLPGGLDDLVGNGATAHTLEDLDEDGEVGTIGEDIDVLDIDLGDLDDTLVETHLLHNVLHPKGVVVTGKEVEDDDDLLTFVFGTPEDMEERGLVIFEGLLGEVIGVDLDINDGKS